MSVMSWDAKRSNLLFGAGCHRLSLSALILWWSREPCRLRDAPCSEILKEAFITFSLSNLILEGVTVIKFRQLYGGQIIFSIIFSLYFSLVKNKMRKGVFLFQIISAILFNLASFLAFLKSESSFIHKCILALTLVIFPLATRGTKLFYKCSLKIV